MSEELKDASKELPRAMMWSITLNGILGITMVISFCFCIKDVEAFVNAVSYRNLSPENRGTYLNHIAGFRLPDRRRYILYHGLLRRNLRAYFVPPRPPLLLGCVYGCKLFSSDLELRKRSRRPDFQSRTDRVQLTDSKGFPYSEWIRQVQPGSEVPVNSLIVCLVVSLILACIQFGSDVALNAILSVSNAALLFSYIISIGALRIRRIRGDPLPPRRWSLGKFGGVINDVALAFLVVAFFFSFWPSYVLIGDATALADFNWAVVVLAIVGILAFAYYYLGGGRNKYVAPVSLVVKDL